MINNGSGRGHDSLVEKSDIRNTKAEREGSALKGSSPVNRMNT